MSRVTTELVIGCSLFVILAAGGSYLLARSALKPVERLRAEVSDLSVRDVPATLAVPRTHDEISALASTMNELLVRVRTSSSANEAWSLMPVTNCGPRLPSFKVSWSWRNGRVGPTKSSWPP